MSLIALAVSPGSAFGAHGALDPSFGENGKVVTQTALGDQSWLDADVNVAEGTDGTIVVAIGDAVFRYLPDGSLDPSFGNGGKLTVAAELEGMPFTPHDLAVDTEGRIYLLGEAEVTDVEVPISYIGGWIHPSLAAVVRYTADGRLDTSYDDGKGYLISDLGQKSRYDTAAAPYEKGLTSLTAGRIGPDDSLIAIGSVGELPCSPGHSRLAMHRRLIVRLTPEGALDPAFGEGAGVQTLPALEEIGSLALGGKGEIAVTGSRTDSCAETTTYGVGRLGAAGEIDGRFGNQGVRALSSGAEAVAIDRFGRLILLLPGWQVLRFTPRGTPDRRLGRHGRVRLRLPVGTYPQSLSIDLSGHLLLAGSRLGPSRQDMPGNPRIPHAFTITELTPQGRRDRRFGHDGWVVTRFGKRSAARGDEAFVDSEGRLVVAGTIARPDLGPTGGVALARYELER